MVEKSIAIDRGLESRKSQVMKPVVCSTPAATPVSKSLIASSKVILGVVVWANCCGVPRCFFYS